MNERKKNRDNEKEKFLGSTTDFFHVSRASTAKEREKERAQKNAIFYKKTFP